MIKFEKSQHLKLIKSSSRTAEAGKANIAMQSTSQHRGNRKWKTDKTTKEATIMVTGYII